MLHGSSQNALEVVTHEVNTVTDNPLIFHQDDTGCVALKPLRSASDQRLSERLDPTVPPLTTSFTPCTPTLDNVFKVCHTSP